MRVITHIELEELGQDSTFNGKVYLDNKGVKFGVANFGYASFFLQSVLDNREIQKQAVENFYRVAEVKADDLEALEDDFDQYVKVSTKKIKQCGDEICRQRDLIKRINNAGFLARLKYAFTGEMK